MYTFDIVIDLSETEYDYDIELECDEILGRLYGTRQIINTDYQFIRVGQKIKIPVTCPELHSLDRENTTEYAKKWIDSLEHRLNKKIEFIQTGTEAQYEGYQVPAKSSFYILYYGKFSPLICGDTYDPIPLYKIPYTNHDNTSYNDIRAWYWSYDSIYQLWLIGTVGEKYALTQMQNVHSALSKEGRSICKRIEEVTGVPTYYFLFNYRAWGRKKDSLRKCPITGKNWLIEGTTFNDFIAFKCEESRLVSQLSSNK